jgi:transposase
MVNGTIVVKDAKVLQGAYHYPTKVTDAQWDVLHSLLPQRAWRLGGRGRPPLCDMRCIVNGNLYLHSVAERLTNASSWYTWPQEEVFHGYHETPRRLCACHRLS